MFTPGDNVFNINSRRRATVVNACILVSDVQFERFDYVTASVPNTVLNRAGDWSRVVSRLTMAHIPGIQFCNTVCPECGEFVAVHKWLDVDVPSGLVISCDLS